jgi:hypothetical protein
VVVGMAVDVVVVAGIAVDTVKLVRLMVIQLN